MPRYLFEKAVSLVIIFRFPQFKGIWAEFVHIDPPNYQFWSSIKCLNRLCLFLILKQKLRMRFTRPSWNSTTFGLTTWFWASQVHIFCIISTSRLSKIIYVTKTQAVRPHDLGWNMRQALMFRYFRIKTKRIKTIFK